MAPNHFLVRVGPHPHALLADARPASGRLPRLTDSDRSRAPRSRAPAFPRPALPRRPSPSLQHQERDVVVLRRGADERIELGEHGVDDVIGRLVAVAGEAIGQA
jgi:hypothetical protein